MFIIGVLIRHYFNTQHARKGNPTWTWLAAAILFIIIIWLSTVPKVLTGEPKVSARRADADRLGAFPGGARHGARPLLDVPCGGAVL